MKLFHHTQWVHHLLLRCSNCSGPVHTSVSKLCEVLSKNYEVGLTQPFYCAIVHDIASALLYLLRHEIPHRCLSAEQIVICRDTDGYQAKLADFHPQQKEVTYIGNLPVLRTYQLFSTLTTLDSIFPDLNLGEAYDKTQDLMTLPSESAWVFAMVMSNLAQFVAALSDTGLPQRYPVVSQGGWSRLPAYEDLYSELAHIFSGSAISRLENSKVHTPKI